VLLRNGNYTHCVYFIRITYPTSFVDLANAARSQLIQKFKLSCRFLFKNLYILKTMFKLTCCKELPFELTLLDLITVVGDYIDHCIRIQ